MIEPMRLAIIGGALFVLGMVAVLTGVLPAADALVIADRVWPVLLFVVAVTVVAELAASAGVFDLAGAWLARVSRGRVVVLWMLVVLLAVAATAFLSLDTTAVLLTPVVVAVARAHRLPPLPFAFATVWLANTASLVLPVSNLTNLLAVHRLGDITPWGFLALLGPSALIAIVVSVLLLSFVFRRDLRGRFEPTPAERPVDPVLTAIVGGVVVVLLPFLVSGLPPWIPSVVAAVVVVLVVAWRERRMLRFAHIPWQLVVFAGGLFLAVGALEELGSGLVVGWLAGSGTDLVTLLRMSGVGALGANAVNNLPAYLAIESTAGESPARLAALLIGVNAGPLVTPWASLATLLWHQRLVSVGVEVRWSRFVLLGLVGAPLVVGLAVLPLALTT